MQLAVTDEIMDEAFRVATKRKKERPEVQKIIKNYEKCKAKLRKFLAEGVYVPFVHKAKVINDGFKLKKRII